MSSTLEHSFLTGSLFAKRAFFNKGISQLKAIPAAWAVRGGITHVIVRSAATTATSVNVPSAGPSTRRDETASTQSAALNPSTAFVSSATLGIPPSPKWQVPPFPKTPLEALQTFASPEFRQAVGTPQGILQATYSATRTAYFIGQSFYAARTINYRAKEGVFKDGVPSNPVAVLQLIRERMGPTLGSISELHRRDMENVRKGFYRQPYDMDPRHRQWNPSYMVENADTFVEFARDTHSRREREGRKEVLETSAEARANPDRYPEYYLQNFHFQDGWLSEFSANSYEIATESLFFGSQDAMQRGGLVPLHFFMRGRSERSTRLLELACGTGRFLTFIKDNYPRMQTTAVDLSPFFLDKARANMDYFTEFDKTVNGDRRIAPTDFIQASAESLPLPDQSYDVISCVYLFHELPPDVRTNVVKEMARVLKPGGIVIFNDSIQREDRPEVDHSLFPRNYHEPYYLSYVDTDLEALFGKEGFCLESSSVLHVSKVMCFRKL